MVEGWVVAIVVTASLTAIGWLVSRMTTQNEVIRTQRETIETQRRAIDVLEITGKLQEQMFSALPRPRSGGKT